VCFYYFFLHNLFVITAFTSGVLRIGVISLSRFLTKCHKGQLILDIVLSFGFLLLYSVVCLFLCTLLSGSRLSAIVHFPPRNVVVNINFFIYAHHNFLKARYSPFLLKMLSNHNRLMFGETNGVDREKSLQMMQRERRWRKNRISM